MPLSAYELARQETIARNNSVLASLGLDKPFLPKQPPAAKRKRKDADPDYHPPELERRTTRITHAPKKQQIVESSDEDDDEDTPIR